MRWLIVLILFSGIAYAETDRQKLLRMADEIRKKAGEYGEGQHCVITYHDDGIETKECQNMNDAPTPTGLIFNCKGIGKQLVCNHK